MSWRTVLSTFNVVEATLITAHLEDAGIPTRKRQEAGGALGLTVGPFGQIDILVPKSMGERALTIIESLREKIMATTDVFNSKYFRLYELADGVYAAIIKKEDSGTGGNSGFVDLGNYVLAFDALLQPQAAQDLLDAIDALTGKPVRFLVNSHRHSDHIFGNYVFPEETLIISTPTTHRELVEYRDTDVLEEEKEEDREFLDDLKKELDAASDDATRQALTAHIRAMTMLIETYDDIVIRLPNVTFEERVTFYGPARAAELITYGVGHTGGDAFLYLPEEHIIFTGDLLFAKALPFFVRDSISAAWAAVLDKMLTLDIEVVVPGHGEVSTVGDIRAERDYLKEIEERVRQVIADGGAADAAANIPIPEAYAEWEGVQRFPDTMRFLFERLSEK